MLGRNRCGPVWSLLIMVAVLLLTACSQSTPTLAPASEVDTWVEVAQPIFRFGEVADREWVLVGYGDAGNPTIAEEGAVITANFSSVDGQVAGSGGCNNYFANYEAGDDGSMSIGPVGTTMMACEIGADQETTYLAALESVTGWGLTEEGRLELAYDSGKPFEEKLVFAPGETPLTGPSNDISVGPITTAQQACDEKVMGQEQTYLASLQTASRYTISGTTLTLNTADGSLVFGGPVATPAATQ